MTEASFLPFRLLRKAMGLVYSFRVTSAFSLLPPASCSLLLLTAFCLLLLTSCKSAITPPEDHPSGPDTTSHNFLWTAETLGVQGTLYDVAIINDTLAYAVGEIYERDSTGQIDPLLYNVAQWNGITWTLHRIAVDFRGSMITPPLEGVFAFSSTDIWVVGSLPIHGNGQSWTIFDLRSMPGLDSVSLSKGWGSSSSAMYFVGRSGTIMFYNGSTWQKLEIQPSAGQVGSLTLTDVWGLGTRRLSAELTLSVGSDYISGTNHHVFWISPAGVQDTLGWTMGRTPTSTWFTTPSSIFVAGNGIWKHENGAWTEVFPQNYVNRIRGTGENNIFAAGYQFIAHYNGSSWVEYPEVQSFGTTIGGLAVIRSMVVGVGFSGQQAIAIRGYPR